LCSPIGFFPFTTKLLVPVLVMDASDEALADTDISISTI
jgi:hypothetical protein